MLSKLKVGVLKQLIVIASLMKQFNNHMIQFESYLYYTLPLYSPLSMSMDQQLSVRTDHAIVFSSFYTPQTVIPKSSVVTMAPV